jgi:hypothetical protein
MPDVQEVFRMTTQKIRPEPGFVDRQYDHRRKQQRKRKIGAFAAAAVIGVAAVALIVNNLGGGESGTDIVDSPPQTAQEVATGFLDAYGAYDADRAIGYLANDADIKALMTEVGAQDVDGTVKEFRLLLSYLQAMGYTQILDPCEELGSSAAGTSLRCSFDFHALRSDEIELGPFGGSYFDLTVLDGRIVRASKFFATEGFSVEVWEPFAAFVSTAYPEDAAVMYVDDTYSEVRLTEASIRLWDEHTRGYVEEVQAGGA